MVQELAGHYLVARWYTLTWRCIDHSLQYRQSARVRARTCFEGVIRFTIVLVYLELQLFSFYARHHIFRDPTPLGIKGRRIIDHAFVLSTSSSVVSLTKKREGEGEANT